MQTFSRGCQNLPTIVRTAPIPHMTSSRFTKNMNLTTEVRSRRRLVPRVQVWVFWVRIRWLFRISARLGRVGSEYRVERLEPRFQSGAVTRDCGHLALFSGQIGNLRQILGHIGYFRVCSGTRRPKLRVSFGQSRTFGVRVGPDMIGLTRLNRKRPVSPTKNTRT